MLKLMIKDALQKPEINFWVGLLIPLLVVAVGWGTLRNRVGNLENRFDYLGDRIIERQVVVDDRLDKRDEVLVQIQVSLGKIQTDLEYIKTYLK